MNVGEGHEVLMGVGCLCPPVRNDIVTPRHLFFLLDPCPVFSIDDRAGFKVVIFFWQRSEERKKKGRARPRNQTNNL